MQDSTFDTAQTLAQRLASMSPDEIVKMGRELCAALSKDPDGCHGGIWPGNVRFDDDGKAILGEPSSAPVASRSADEIEYLAPEMFWDNLRSPAADVYSVGMLMYVAANGGRLPFLTAETDGDLDRAKALRSRMKGDALPPLEGLSDELSALLTKALAHDPAQRFATPAELLHALSETHEALPAEGGDGGLVGPGGGLALPVVGDGVGHPEALLVAEDRGLDAGPGGRWLGGHCSLLVRCGGRAG